jgi:MFS family permease
MGKDEQHGLEEGKDVSTTSSSSTNDNCLSSPSPPPTAREWSKERKYITTWVVSLFKFISGLTSTSIVPNLPAIATQFGTAPGALSIFPLSTYFLGYAAGLLLIGPLSETFGRVGALQLSNLSFIVFNTAAGFAQTNAQLIVLRVLSGFGGAGPLSVRAILLAFHCSPN